MALCFSSIYSESNLFLATLQNEHSRILLHKGHARVQLFFSFPGNNYPLTRKSLGQRAAGTHGIIKGYVCHGLMSHNNGTLWFTRFDGLFYVSSMLSGLCCNPLVSHIPGSLYILLLWAQSPRFAFWAH